MARLVYSPIDLHTKPDQFEQIKKLSVKNALALAFSPEAVTPTQKLEVLLGKQWEDGVKDPDSLVAKAESAGIENMIIDVGVIDLQGTAWSALSVELVKKTLGLPAGCAPANALFSWQRTHKDTLKNSSQTVAAGAAVYASTTYFGADFVLYGPMRCAEWAYPACAVADTLMSYGNRLSGIRPKNKSHPLFKLK
jgi:tetrahydromethanopterin S-methyltransferase subunit H